MMQTYSEQEIRAKIDRGECFRATLSDGSFTLILDDYVPYVCTAIHAGHHLCPELQQRCLLSAQQRLLEEDPHTELFIQAFPIRLILHDSRYEYDLNRTRDKAIYENAWGYRVWRKELTKLQMKRSLAKYDCYYRILTALLDKLHSLFQKSLIIDVHSYNWMVRQYDYAPVFNLGTAHIDMRSHAKFIRCLTRNLRLVSLPNLETTVGVNAVFKGQGHQAVFIQKNYPTQCANIAFEVKKIYMNEQTGEQYPLVIQALQQGVYHAILDSLTECSSKSRQVVQRRDLVVTHIEPAIKSVDKQLFQLAQNIETLYFLNPVNLYKEKKLFFSRKRYEPKFKYRQLNLDPYLFRQALYQLPVSDITNPPIRQLYQSVVNSLATKIALLTSIGTDQFLYNSLRYYGEPNLKDLANANFLLHCKELSLGTFEDNQFIDVDTAYRLMCQAAKDMGLNCTVIKSNRIVAKAMVNNSRKTLLLNSKAKFSVFEVKALIHHELGIHMVTTLNGLKQPLNVLRLGLPGNTFTQEGLAILAEFLTNTLDMKRVKKLALRVLAVDRMIKGNRFSEVYNELYEHYSLTRDEAFTIAVRVFRGGGFTKDYLYLKGLSQLFKLYQQRDLSSLMIGKTSLHFIDTLDEMIAHQQLNPPHHQGPILNQEHKPDNPVLNYIIGCIKY